MGNGPTSEGNLKVKDMTSAGDYWRTEAIFRMWISMVESEVSERYWQILDVKLQSKKVLEQTLMTINAK